MLVRLDDDRMVRSGIKGQADIYGLVRGGGHIELEVKAVRGHLTKPQLAWQAFCLEWGVPYLLLKARAGESEKTTISRWCMEIRRLITDRTPIT